MPKILGSCESGSVSGSKTLISDADPGLNNFGNLLLASSAAYKISDPHPDLIFCIESISEIIFILITKHDPDP
jgi:hypothetical protein